MSININLELSLKTCDSGHVYAIPNWVPGHCYTCPMCAKEQIRNTNQCIQDELDEEIKKDRTIAALRGALTKAKKAMLQG